MLYINYVLKSFRKRGPVDPKPVRGKQLIGIDVQTVMQLSFNLHCLG
jgi:hypothetical protein